MTAARPARGTRTPRNRREAARAATVDRESLRLIGYVRVSTAAQASEKSHGLAAQRRALEKWCRAAGHELVTVIPEVASASAPDRMFGRLAVENALRAGLADAMVVRDLDRASRSTLDGAQLLASGWRVLGTDGTDSADPEQEFLVNVRLAMAQEERRKISRRTREGLDAARASGKTLGRPPIITKATERRIAKLRRDGMSANKIAQALTAKKVPTPNGGAAWSPSTVRTVLARQEA